VQQVIELGNMIKAKKVNANNLTVIISVICVFAVQISFYILKKPLAGLIFLIPVFIMFFISLNNAGEKIITAPDAGKRSRLMEIMLFMAVMAAAVFFRFYMIDSLPPGAHRDEADAVRNAIYMAQGQKPPAADSSLPIYIGGLSDHPTMKEYVMCGFFGIIGKGILQSRISMAFMGTLAVAALYFLLHYLFGSRAALTGGLLFAVSRWDSIASRLIHPSGFTVFFEVIALYFILRACIGQKKPYFILAGALTALCLYGYQSAKAFPPAVAVFVVIYGLMTPGFFRKNFMNIMVAAAAFTVVAMPLGIYMIKHKELFMFRPGLLFVFSPYNLKRFGAAGNPMGYYLGNLKNLLLMFNMRGDYRVEYGLPDKPALDFITGPLAAAGFFALCAFAARGYAAGAGIAGMFAFLVAATSMFIEAPHSPRAVLLMPFCYLFAAFFIFLIAVRGRAGNKIFALIILLCFVSAMQNYREIFRDYYADTDEWDAFDMTTNKMANEIKKIAPAMVYVPPGYLRSWIYTEFEAVYAGFPHNYTQLSPQDGFPDGREKPIFAFLPKHWSLIGYFMKKYPDAAIEIIKNPYSGMDAFYLLKSNGNKTVDAGSKYGLKGYYYGSSTSAAVSSVDPFICFDWNGYGKKYPSLFAVVWKGKIRFDKTGKIIIALNTYDPFDMYIDGAKVMSGNGKDLHGHNTVGINVKAGDIKRIEIKYLPTWDRSVELTWDASNIGDEQVIPPENLIPAD